MYKWNVYASIGLGYNRRYNTIKHPSGQEQGSNKWFESTIKESN